MADAYLLAFEDDAIGAPIKGLTVYRDGSRDEQVLTTRMDNSLDGEERDEEVLDLYTRGEISDTAAVELGVVDEEGEGATCPKEDCDGTLEPSDDCSVCDVCFYSPCS